MAEQINMNVNNLSITEEAFELFQASSMYSEDEIVQLGATACTQPIAVDVTSALNEMPLENEVVSSSNIEDQQLSYCNLEVGSEVNIGEEDTYGANPVTELSSDANPDSSYSNEINYFIQESSEVNKDVDIELNVEYPDNMELGEPIEFETVSNSEIYQPPAASPSKRGRGKGRRRGRGRGRGRSRASSRRKPNSKNKTTDLDTNDTNNVNLSSETVLDDALQNPKNDVHLISNEETNVSAMPVQTNDNPIEEISTVRKRGRRKKVVSPSVSSMDLQSSDSNVSPRSRKRGRPKKGESKQNASFKNVPHVNGDNLSNNLNSSELKDLSAMVENLTQMEDNLSKLEGKLSQIENLDDDEEEDVCLSQLKMTIDSDNTISEPKDPILEEMKELPSSPLPADEKIEEKNENIIPLLEPDLQIKENEPDVDVTTNESVVNKETFEEMNTELNKETSEEMNTELIKETLEEINTELKKEKSEEMNNEPGESLLVEDVTKRPQRRKAKTNLKYKNDDDSEEDPFANVELSDDDEPKRGKKSGRYQSDDEYVPGLEHGRRSSIDSSDSAADDALEELKKQTRKRGRKKTAFESELETELESLTPKKIMKTDSFDDKKEPWRFSSEVTIENSSDENEGTSQSSAGKVSEVSKPVQVSNAWAASNEFENFLAKKIQGTNLKIKKVKPTKTPNVLAPIDIPVLDPNDVTKRTDTGVQTNKIHTATTSSQTTGPGTLSMKTNAPLSTMQSEKACEFLKSIVKTTSELGQLMTQKSEDFIQKKINMENVVDTFKMDYCVKKSFLLLKLAKHNLMQMEEDLSSQYEKFLKDNKLLAFREQEKKIVPKPKEAESDSDCEIIEETPSTPSKPSTSAKQKPKFNPKTVFLNKELSIKIAKKPSEEPKSNKNLNIKGRHTVWINDSVMVKKVKSQQSFLAQDSRNKKPPDSKITVQMVSDFFEDYYHQKAVKACAPFVSTEWLCVPEIYACNYFSVEPDNLTSDNVSRTDEILANTENNTTVSNSDNELSEKTICEVSFGNPTTLFSIVLKNLQKRIFVVEPSDVNSLPGLMGEGDTTSNVSKTHEPMTLFSLCLKHLTKNESSIYQTQDRTFQKDGLLPHHQEKVTFVNGSDLPSSKYGPLSETDMTLFSLCLEHLTKNDSSIHHTQEHTFQNDCLFPHNHEKVASVQESELPTSKYDPLSETDMTLFSLSLKHLTKNDSLIYQTQECTFQEDCSFPYHQEKVTSVQDSELPSFKNEPLPKTDISYLNNEQKPSEVPLLKTLCHNRVSELYYVRNISDQDIHPRECVSERKDCENIKNNNTPFVQSSDALPVNNVKSLFTMCFELIQCFQKTFRSNETSDFCETTSSLSFTPISLKQIAFEYVKFLLNDNQTSETGIDVIQNVNNITFEKIKTLAELSFDTVTKFYEGGSSKSAEEEAKGPEVELTINAVNSLTEEAFLNITETSANDHNSDYYEDDDDNRYEDECGEPDMNNDEVDENECGEPGMNIDEVDENECGEPGMNIDEVHEGECREPDMNNDDVDSSNTENESWVSQIQLEALNSCFVSSKSKKTLKSISETEDSNIATETYPLIAVVKSEPGLEESSEKENCDNFVPVIKTEPNHDLDQMTIIPDSIVTKRECLENVDPLPGGREPVIRQDSTSFDETSFEAFVRTNKMMYPLDEVEGNTEQTFSQSGLRVRRQHEPDSDNENDTSMSLLVPQTFEPLTVESAKGSLLDNSSSDGESTGKKNNKRKPVIRRKTKKTEPVKQNSKDIPAKEKPNAINEVAMLTRKMREKIRQEEKKVESSESECESTSEILRREKESKKAQISTRTPVKKNKSVNDEIQCSNVDSTAQVSDAAEQVADGAGSKSNLESKKSTKDGNHFTGFTAIDQNEISTYHKYVKYVYDQIIPKVNEETQAKKIETSDNKEKKETLDNDEAKKTFDTKETKKTLDKKETSNNKETKDNKPESIENDKDSQIISPDEPVELLECTPTMPIFDDVVQAKRKSTKAEIKSPNAKKAPKDSHPKLPSKATESITNKNDLVHKDEKEDNFIERHGWKCYPINSSDTKIYQEVMVPLEKLPESFVETYFKYQEVTDKTEDDAEIDRLINLQSLNRLSSVNKSKSKNKASSDDQVKSTQKNTEQLLSPADAGDYNELTPSEDEGADYDDDCPTPSIDSAENHMAKNSLMNDDDDSDAALSKHKTGELNDRKKKSKLGKSKLVEVKHEHPDSLMLTADKMMNKELTLLHAPVVLDDKTGLTPTKGPITRNKQRSATKNYSRMDRSKSDDSSSEEEKQWVTTKEKLLKRMGKKQETALEDDAKRAKLVSEFIEKRNDKPEVRKARGPSKRSRRKLLERQKQMRVLSHELLGDASTHTGKSNSAAYFKGRRNIRKVIDKKSLARSTVIANMEEFERKRRLSMKQVQLQTLLGCDEGVNVLVINDEVCLEYDFEELRPAVTVHPFFTKVMKAHQYEGVKFMWDACFESLEVVESGSRGGGCILAHCMGLGKTLQVLALLHTVLTHPRVGMHRVLVCCPLSTVLNWVDEIHKWIGPVTDEIKVFELSKLKKTYERAYQLEDWYNGGGIFIIGYELFRSLTTLDAELDDIRQTIIDKIRSALLDPGPDIIICDEGHLLKNDCSVLAVAMSRVATRRRIVLTGTPMQNNLREYYCMVNFVKPNLLGTYSEYSNRFENPIMNGQHRDSQVEDIKLMKARTHILHKVLEGCLQRQEASVLYPYLPKKHEYTVFISLTKCQCDLYKHYLQCYTQSSKQSILRDFHTLQKIWSHPQVLHNFQMKSRDEKNKLKAEKLEDDLACEDLTASEDMKPTDTEVWWLQYLEGGKMLECLESSNKFVAVFRILQESVALDDKVLIFSTSLITMDALEYFLKKINKWSLGQEYYRLDGSVPPEVRQKWCREFNAEHNYKTKLFLISTRAGSLGLNMTAANRVIILDTSWNPAHDIQSIFRVYRFGQKKDCYIYRLVALGTMEQKIYERAVTKQAVSCRVVDEQQIDRHYNMAELTELYRFDETGSGVAGGVAVGVQDVVLLRVARDSALHAVHEHDSLLRGSEPALPEHERAAAWQQFQQETQRDQIKSEAVPKKDKKIAKRSLSIDKSSTIEIKDEPSDNVNVTTPTEPRSKRGKKIINCCIPIQTPQPSTSAQPDEFLIDKTQENDMVSKITQILLSHEYNKRGSRDISKLIGTVRQIVANGDLSKLPPGDDLAANIAQVLLRKEVPKMPALTDVCSNTTQPQRLEETPFLDSNAETITGDLNSKPKRRAAATAEKKLDSIASDIVIDLNDDDWRGGSDTDSAPDVQKYEQQPEKPKYKPGPKCKKKLKEQIKPARKELVESIQKAIDENESILLSDDEITPEVPTISVKQEITDKKEESAEKYPLHPSLLTNQNFVKIVAHTYLAGNPMLDEDAATLAARYSTGKALRELEETGKCIDSGPIYDIAVKVLGADILKKLHTSGANAKTLTTKTTEEKVSDTERMLSEAMAGDKKESRPKLKPKVMSELMPKEKPKSIPNLGFVKLTPVVQQPVVPVGLIKRAVPVATVDPPSGDECILPDDDDLRIVSAPPTPLPTPAPSPPPAPPRPGPATRRHLREATPVILNSVLSQTQPAQTNTLLSNISVSSFENRPVIKICGNRVISVGAEASPLIEPRAPPAPAASDMNTICLDSDDEDAAPAPKAAPKVAPAPEAPKLTPASKVKWHRKQPSLLRPIAPKPAPAVPVSLTSADGVRHELISPGDYMHNQQPPPKHTSMPLVAINNARPSNEPSQTSRASDKTITLNNEASKLCKPGDIIRISKNGEVEVLNKVDPGSDMHTRIMTGRAGPVTKVSASDATEALAKAADPKVRDTSDECRIMSSGSSSSSRSASPDDPMSILRNVVHIPADRYQNQRNSPRQSQTTKAPTKPVAELRKPTIENKPGSVLSTLKTKEATPSTKSTSAKASTLLSKLSKNVTVGKSSRVVMESVDLTEVSAPEPVKPRKSLATPSISKARTETLTKPSKPKTDTVIKPSKPKTETVTKPSKPKEPVKPSPSKNIVVTGSSKNIILTPSNPIKGGLARVTKVETIAMDSFKRTDPKKRPAVKTEAEAPKRKKTEPMTLKDFNIDDIDDIIELE